MGSRRWRLAAWRHLQVSCAEGLVTPDIVRKLGVDGDAQGI
ncbi:hypothetical protein ACFVH6_23560 [Spirillospora sp. NPDC127200]